MKDLLSKEHYCYNINTLLMKSSARSIPPPFYRQPLPPPFHEFSKILRAVHTMTTNNNSPIWIDSILTNLPRNFPTLRVIELY